MPKNQSYLLTHLPHALFFCIFGGVVVTELMPQFSNYYWYGLCVLFSLVYAFSGTKQSSHNKVTHHLLHWLGAGIAILIVFMFQYQKLISANQAALFNIVIVGMAAFTDGIRIGFKFSLVGIYLFWLALVLSLIEEYLWLFIGLSVLIVAVQWFWSHKQGKNVQTTNSDTTGIQSSGPEYPLKDTNLDPVKPEPPRHES